MKNGLSATYRKIRNFQLSRTVDERDVLDRINRRISIWERLGASLPRVVS
jgi:hypothetical protein